MFLYVYLSIMIKNLRITVLLLLTAVVAGLVSATVIEKFKGHEFVTDYIYGSFWMIALWALLSLFGFIMIVCCRLYRRKAAVGIHLSFLVILCGALLTHFTSHSGVMSLRLGETSNLMICADNTTELLPFNVRLDTFVVKYYGGTDTPQDYVSGISFLRFPDKVDDRDTVSMNKVVNYDNYRFFQTSYSPDMQECMLSVSYDPYGMTVSYVGYGCLVLCMMFFFFDRNSMFRKSLRKIRRLTMFFLLFLPLASFAEPLKSPSGPVADKFGEVLVLYQGRICPVNTLALDFCRKLYNGKSYKGHSANQVLCGWMFYPMEWRSEIKLDVSSSKDKQKLLLIESLFNGDLLKMYPVAVDGAPVRWVGRSSSLPESISVEEWTFIRKVQNYLQQFVMLGQDAEAIELIGNIKRYQDKKTAGAVPRVSEIKAELLYNSITHTKLVAIICLVIGLLCFVCSTVYMARGSREPRWQKRLERILVATLSLYLFTLFVLRWVVLGSIPLSNGYEAMEFMALLVSLFVIAVARFSPLVLPAGFLVTGFCLLVALFGESDPPITPLMPVLSSPLLSVHVMTIMLSYALMAIMFVISLSAIIVTHNRKCSVPLSSVETEADGVQSSVLPEVADRLTTLNCLLLTPSVFLLAVGIFVGAVWANVSWGSYWQWDPKETWALITLLVYSLPLHKFSKLGDQPIRFNFYLVVAFLCVLVTYFGVNYFLGGMHSYA